MERTARYIPAAQEKAGGTLTKFNRKFNAKRKRIERWHNITVMLAGFEGVINFYDGASPEEVRTMKSIHKKLYECLVMAKKVLEEVNAQ